MAEEYKGEEFSGSEVYAMIEEARGFLSATGAVDSEGDELTEVRKEFEKSGRTPSDVRRAREKVTKIIGERNDYH